MAKQKDLTKELEKMNIQIDKISEKEMRHIMNVEEWMEKKYKESVESIKEINKLDFSLRDYCKENNISRAALYKKNSDGESLYPNLLLYSESIKKVYIEKTKNLFKKFIPEQYSELKEKIDKLVKRDVEYMQMKEKVSSLERKIKSLEKENSELLKKKNIS